MRYEITIISPGGARLPRPRPRRSSHKMRVFRENTPGQGSQAGPGRVTVTQEENKITVVIEFEGGQSA